MFSNVRERLVRVIYVFWNKQWQLLGSSYFKILSCFKICKTSNIAIVILDQQSTFFKILYVYLLVCKINCAICIYALVWQHVGGNMLWYLRIYDTCTPYKFQSSNTLLWLRSALIRNIKAQYSQAKDVFEPKQQKSYITKMTFKGGQILFSSTLPEGAENVFSL